MDRRTFLKAAPAFAVLAELLKLRPEQRVLYGQTVGYPAES